MGGVPVLGGSEGPTACRTSPWWLYGPARQTDPSADRRRLGLPAERSPRAPLGRCPRTRGSARARSCSPRRPHRRGDGRRARRDDAAGGADPRRRGRGLATVASGVRLAGNVRVGRGAYVGAGADRERCRIGSGSLVGMGAVVTRDIPPDRCGQGSSAIHPARGTAATCHSGSRLNRRKVCRNDLDSAGRPAAQHAAVAQEVARARARSWPRPASSAGPRSPRSSRSSPRSAG